jgi:hypothetical protein
LLRSEIDGSGGWQMGSPGGARHQADTGELERTRRLLEEKEAELERYRPREPSDEGEAPVYKLLGPAFLGSSPADHQIFEAGSVIEFWDVPNHMNMVPLNDAARRRMEAELAHQESCRADVLAAAGIAHGGGVVGDIRQLLDETQAVARRVAAESSRHPLRMPTEDALTNPPPLQAHLAKKRPGRPKRTVRDVSPPAADVEA